MKTTITNNSLSHEYIVLTESHGTVATFETGNSIVDLVNKLLPYSIYVIKRNKERGVKLSQAQESLLALEDKFPMK